MLPLRRHQLVRINEAGWAAVRSRLWDDEARACLSHWAAQQLPLVVTRQPEGLDLDQLALGLPAPTRWGRRRLALQVPRSSLLYLDEFPAAAGLTVLLPAPLRGAWRQLVAGLDAAGAEVRVYGSYGWQRLTGLSYLRGGSDMDLRLAVPDAATADRVAALLHGAPFDAPCLDGELMFPDGSAVAWREWLAWRQRRVDRVLVRRLHGASMETGEAWLKEALPC